MADLIISNRFQFYDFFMKKVWGSADAPARTPMFLIITYLLGFVGWSTPPPQQYGTD